MTIVRTYVPDPELSALAQGQTQAPPSHEGSNLPADEPVWAAARQSYLRGFSTPVVAERHGLNARTVRRRAAKEGWAEMRRRLVAGLEERRRAGVLAGEPLSGEEAVARDPELEDFVAAHSFEVGELLLKPDADRLSRFAFRRAAEMAAEGRPQEAGVWMRLVAQAGRAADHLERLSRPFSPAEHMRAQYAAQLRDVFMGPDAEG